MGARINNIFGMSRVTSKGSAPELVKRDTNTRVTCMVDALKQSENLCAITMRYKEIGKSSRIDDKVIQDQRQRDDMISKMRDKINPRKKRLNLEEAKGQEPRNHLDPICYKWIFKKKRKADGTVVKYKARLVIKGFRQREGLDYFDTYSTRITSVHMILAIAALRNLEVHQIDVKKAFLNGDLEEKIYMNQPEGFMAPGLESKVCRLVKSLYDLRKAPK
ncbi:retrotransposon protein, putative, ty1-copia subclass [Tanacetum coccineum]